MYKHINNKCWSKSEKAPFVILLYLSCPGIDTNTIMEINALCFTNPQNSKTFTQLSIQGAYVGKKTKQHEQKIKTNLWRLGNSSVNKKLAHCANLRILSGAQDPQRMQAVVVRVHLQPWYWGDRDVHSLSRQPTLTSGGQLLRETPPYLDFCYTSMGTYIHSHTYHTYMGGGDGNSRCSHGSRQM